MNTELHLGDIDFNKFAEKILSLLSSNKPHDFLISDIVILVQEETGIESVGLRLKDGYDFPYYFTRGFSLNFVEKEMYLCARNQAGELVRDSQGNPYLECMCGNVISGRTDSTLPFFTLGGSFWTNSTTDLLATTTVKERQSRTRDRCNSEGYESVALIPIIHDMKNYGLLQLNDRRRGIYSEGFIQLMEWVASSIGILFSFIQLQETLSQHIEDIKRRHPSRVLGPIKEKPKA